MTRSTSATCPERRRLRRARGFSLIMALFLLVSLAAMGAYLLTVSTLQQEASAADEMGARAYQAAHAGIDWGLYQLLRDPAGAYASACDAAPAAQSFALGGALAAFSVKVECSATAPTTEGARSGLRAYTLKATACNQASCPGTPDAAYVERQLEASVTN